MSAQNSVNSVYKTVIDEVCQGVRNEFEEMGIDESILQELRRSWQSKVAQARQSYLAGEANYAASESGASSNGNGPGPSSSSSAQGPSTQGFGYYDAAGNFVPTNAGGTIFNAQGQPLPASDANATPADGNRSASASSSGPDGRSFLPNGMSAASLANVGAATLPVSPSHDARAAEARASDALMLEQFERKRALEEESGRGEAEKLEREAERKRAKRARQLESGGRFDDPDDVIGSDLDDTDDEDDGDVEAEEDTNIILCTYEKVTRTKNKWKCILKDGIMTVDGKDYVFHKANGDYEW